MLFTFPSRYWSTIGLTGVFSLAGWSRPLRAGFHVSRVTQDTARRDVASGTGLSPSSERLSRRFPSPHHLPRRGPTTPAVRKHTAGLGFSRVARHYLGNHCYFLFLRVLRCFSSPRSPHDSNCHDDSLTAAGLSHSEIRGSEGICPSPRLIAAYHVLHRLREPRHPPCALVTFSISVRTYMRVYVYNMCVYIWCAVTRSCFQRACSCSTIQVNLIVLA